MLHPPAPAPRGRPTRADHPWLWTAGAVVAAAPLWLSHLPSLLLHAQLYADDGAWYSAASLHGALGTLLLPANGYLVLLQRSAAAVALAVPLIAVPALFNVVALLVVLGGVAYLVSPRMGAAIPRPAVRAAAALVILALPNAYDTMGNLTNSQWHLALIAFLVIFATPPRGIAGWAVDIGVLVVAGLTGPYAVLLAPIAAWRFRRERWQRRAGVVLLVVAACAALQGGVALTQVGAERVSGPLDAGVVPLVTMLGRQLTLGLLSGAHGLTALMGTPLADDPVVLGLLAAVPLAVCAVVAWRGPDILRGLWAFALLTLVAALASPSIGPPRWRQLGVPAGIAHFHPHGIRYFLFALLAFALSLGWMAWWGLLAGRRRTGTGRDAGRLMVGAAAAALLLIAASQGVPRDWAYPPYLDEHWAAEVRAYELAPPGARVVLPINPAGWTMTLVAPGRAAR